jgi:hypothetical protein
MTDAKASRIGVIGITPRVDREISDEIDSCEILLKTNGILPLRREIFAGHGKISVEGSHLDHAVQVLVDDGFEATIFSD